MHIYVGVLVSYYEKLWIFSDPDTARIYEPVMTIKLFIYLLRLWRRCFLSSIRENEIFINCHFLIEEAGKSTLDANILALLGDEQPCPDPVGPDLATRWSFILNNGLSEDSANILLKKYSPPQNGALLKAPCVSPEVATVIDEQAVRRDSNLAKLQNQIGAAFSAFGQFITTLISEERGGEAFNY